MWRRFAEMLGAHPAPPTDERSTKARQLAAFERDVTALNAELRTIADGAHTRLTAELAGAVAAFRRRR